MSQGFQLRQAERRQAKLRIGLFGPSGAGKTMSALRLAHGLAPWEKIAIIDTEAGSADLYSHIGPYNVMKLEAPFTPERYIEAIRACEQAGMSVVIVDSVTHEWSGVGGVLEIADQLAVAAKNSFSVWNKLTPRHNRFIDAIITSPCHMIACARTKQDYVLNQVEKGNKVINVPEKVGLKAVTREGFEYEMTIAFDIAINHYATTSKDRTGLFMGRPEFMISEETGAQIVEWNSNAKPDPMDQKRAIVKELDRLGLQTKDRELIIADVAQLTGLPLKEEYFEEIITKLKEIGSIEEAAANRTVELKNTQAAETPAPDVQEPEKQQPENELKMEQVEAPKPATKNDINLLRSLVKSKYGVDGDDQESLLGYLSLALGRDINSENDISHQEAQALSKELLDKKSVPAEEEKE